MKKTKLEISKLLNVVDGMPPVPMRVVQDNILIPESIKTQEEALDYIKGLPEYEASFVRGNVVKVLWVPERILEIIIDPIDKSEDPVFSDDDINKEIFETDEDPFDMDWD